jgi:hypothetical protein
MRTNSYGDHLKHWEELTATVASHPELALLEPLRALLETELDLFRDANLSQADLRSQAQGMSRTLQEHVARGRLLATQLRDGIRAIYGRSAEQLVGFRMQPRRPRSKTKAPVPPSPENTKPSEQGSTPTRTASPETDASTQE